MSWKQNAVHKGKHIKIQYQSAAFREILSCGETKSWLQATAQKMAAAAKQNGGGNCEFGAAVKMGAYGGGRAYAVVSAENHAAMAAESENKALSKAVIPV